MNVNANIRPDNDIVVIAQPDDNIDTIPVTS